MSQTRVLIITTAAFAGAMAALSAPAQAQCVNPPFAVNWLQQQEAPNVPAAPPPNGGHTIAQHVGKTDQQMINRVLNGGVNADGSYPNAGAAQVTITTALAANAVAVNNWRNGVGVGASQRFNYTAPGNIGRVAYPVGNPPNAVAVADTCAFAVVMRALPGGACYLLTSFPRPATPGDNCP